MIFIVNKKTFRELRSAMLLQFFGMGYRDTRRAMVSIACLKCRKARLGLKVMTAWYRRYEQRWMR